MRHVPSARGCRTQCGSQLGAVFKEAGGSAFAQDVTCAVVLAGFAPHSIFQPSSPSHTEVQLHPMVCEVAVPPPPLFSQAAALMSVEKGEGGEAGAEL